MAHAVHSYTAEEARIRAAYARRPPYDSRYSWLTPGHQFLIQELERRMLNLLRRFDFTSLESVTILDVGCGSGGWLRDFVKWGARPANVTGIDLLPERVIQAQELSPPGMRLHCASAADLPFGSESFDIVFQSTVFTSILDLDLKRRMAAEMVRVLKRQGLVIWYDYHMNNPWNNDVRGVKRNEIYLLFPSCEVELHRVTLIPQVARLLAPYSYFFCYLLEKFPPLCTHYLGVIRKPPIESIRQHGSYTEEFAT
jgi:ubiquinone/menaquinone biosynthesis C-methylase UbiE